MRSPRGLLGSLVLLLALPIAVLTQVLFGGGSAVAIHLALAMGCALVAVSAFDFGTPRWLAWIGCVSAGAFAVIFLSQAASTLVGNELFSYFTNEVLGFWPEKILLSLVTFWLVGMLLTASRGKTRILGFVQPQRKGPGRRRRDQPGGRLRPSGASGQMPLYRVACRRASQRNPVARTGNSTGVAPPSRF